MSQTALKQIAKGDAPASPNIGPKERLQAFRNQLEGTKGELQSILGPRVRADLFVAAAWAAVLANPDIVNADRLSFFAALRKAATDGLVPDGREAVLNVYNTKIRDGDRERWIKQVQFLPMVGGLVKKLYESGEATYVDAACVYERDHFSFRRGDSASLEHEPYLGSEAPGPIVAAYCVVKLKSGEIKREVMPARDIAKVRAASKSGERGPWGDWDDQMAIKSVIKRIYKQLPHTPSMDRLIAIDNEVEFKRDDPAPNVQPAAAAGAAPARALNFDPSPTMGDLVGERAQHQPDPQHVERGGGSFDEEDRAQAEALRKLEEADAQQTIDVEATETKHAPAANAATEKEAATPESAPADSASSDTGGGASAADAPASSARDDAAPRVSFAQLEERLRKATTVDAIDEAATLIQTFAHRDQKDLTKVYRERRAQIHGDHVVGN